MQIQYDLEQAAQRELDLGERLLWTGRPDPRRFALQTVPIVLFGIPWTAFALFWMWGASGFGRSGLSGPGALFPLFGLPFVLVGLGMLSAPFWALRKGASTVYAVTDRRLMIISGAWSRSVKSYAPKAMGGLERIERADGSGDLLFAREVSYDSDGDRRTTRVGFYGIPDVRTVERLVLDTFAADRKPERLEGERV